LLQNYKKITTQTITFPKKWEGNVSFDDWTISRLDDWTIDDWTIGLLDDWTISGFSVISGEKKLRRTICAA